MNDGFAVAPERPRAVRPEEWRSRGNWVGWSAYPGRFDHLDGPGCEAGGTLSGRTTGPFHFGHALRFTEETLALNVVDRLQGVATPSYAALLTRTTLRRREGTGSQLGGTTPSDHPHGDRAGITTLPGPVKISRIRCRRAAQDVNLTRDRVSYNRSHAEPSFGEA